MFNKALTTSSLGSRNHLRQTTSSHLKQVKRPARFSQQICTLDLPNRPFQSQPATEKIADLVSPDLSPLGPVEPVQPKSSHRRSREDRKLSHRSQHSQQHSQPNSPQRNSQHHSETNAEPDLADNQCSPGPSENPSTQLPVFKNQS